MAGIRLLNAKLTRVADQNYVRPSYVYADSFYDKRKTQLAAKFMNTYIKVVSSDLCKSNPISILSSTSPTLRFQNVSPFVSVSPVFMHQSNSLSFHNKEDKYVESEISAASCEGDIDVSNSTVIGSDWVDKVKDAWYSAVDAISYIGHKAIEASNELKPHVEQLLDTHPYLKDLVVPIGCTLAWVVLPSLLRRFHNYETSVLSSGARSVFGDQVPYEESFWGALEDPIRNLVTFMAFSQIALMVAPSTIKSEYVTLAWRGTAILSFIWFLHRWKTNVLSRALSAQNLARVDREKLLTMDKFSSFGLFVIGLMALAEGSGIAVQSIVTVGGIGGAATAFAGKDILENVLSGLSMQFSQPFTVGDTIKMECIEGQVMKMGLTSTTLLNSEKFPVLIPNSHFSSQVIVNKSRARFHALVTKIPLQIEDLDKLPNISKDIKNMLLSNSKVYLGKEAPYCFLSHIERSYAELTIGCNLRHMRKDELYSAQEEILLQSVQIIRKHGARMGNC